jgi:hypothetical protein
MAEQISALEADGKKAIYDGISIHTAAVVLDVYTLSGPVDVDRD